MRCCKPALPLLSAGQPRSRPCGGAGGLLSCAEGGREGPASLPSGRASALGLAVKIAARQASSGAELWLRGRGAFAALQTLWNACSCLGGSLCVAVNLYFFKSDCFIDQNIGRPVLWYRGLGFFFFEVTFSVIDRICAYT